MNPYWQPVPFYPTETYGELLQGYFDKAEVSPY